MAAARKDERTVEDSLIREVIGRYEEVGSWQARACTQKGNLHPFVWVPVWQWWQDD